MGSPHHNSGPTPTMNPSLPILWHYWQTKYRRNFTSRAALTNWQHQRVMAFLSKVLPKSPFYQSYYQGLDRRDWPQFPCIDKAIMMANFDRLNTVGIAQAEAMAIAQKAEESRDFSAMIHGYTVGLSSGTSGNRGLFLVSPAEQRAWAGTVLAKSLPQSLFAAQRIAFFLRANSNLYETIKRRHIQFEYFDLFQPIARHIDRLNTVEPSILVAPASMLRMLSDAKLAGKLRIAPRRIIAIAEVLDPLDERIISQAFNQPLHQLYQCTEGFLASTCAYGTLHLNEDVLVIQKDYLDREAGKFMPIITDFNRTTQPIIRYRLDDILTEQRTSCPCGSVLTPIAQIEGRCDDIFYLPSGAGRLIPIFPDFIRRTVILTSGVIQEYAVVQHSLNHIQVYLQLPETQWKETTSSLQDDLERLFNQFGCQQPAIQFSLYEKPMQQAQKLRRVRRNFEVPM
jgi:putative adenylate-forming enzyme